MTRIAAFILFIAGVAAAVGPAFANDWKIYRYPNERFAVEFPNVPKTIDMKAPVEQYVRGIQYLSSDDVGTEYLAQGTLYRKFIRQNHKPDKILRVAIDGVKDAGKCSIRSERNYSFPGAIARELVLEKCSGGKADIAAPS